MPTSQSDAHQARMLDHALAFARIGLRPVPLRHCRPIVKAWPQRASTGDVATRELFREAWAADGIGIATGEGVFVLDLDRGHGDGVDGIAVFADVVRQHGPIPAGPRVRTPRNGLHLYFRARDDHRFRCRTGIAPGVDLKAAGGLATAPPTVRDDGAYRWAPDPFTTLIPIAPTWLLRWIAPPLVVAPEPADVRPFSGHESPYARAALERELRAVALSGEGGRNAALYKGAAALGALSAGGALPVDAVSAGLFAAAIDNGLVGEDGAATVRATIASGLKRGLSQPRAVPQSRSRRHAR